MGFSLLKTSFLISHTSFKKRAVTQQPPLLYSVFCHILFKGFEELKVVVVNVKHNCHIRQKFKEGVDVFYGLEEFIAETNALLTTYGMNYKDINTRTQFLVKYFPLHKIKYLALFKDIFIFFKSLNSNL